MFTPFLPVCTGLVVATKLIGPDLINAVLPLVLERLHHPKVRDMRPDL